jgi:tubulin beta
VNSWVADSIAESTIPFRFSGQLNTSQRKIATNLVLFPRMHFLPFANAPTLAAALKPDAISLTNFYAKDDKSFGVYTGVRDNMCSEQ